MTADIWTLVIEDMHARRQLGIERYGRTLDTDDGRDPSLDAYEELLDAAVYHKRTMIEMARLRAEVADLTRHAEALIRIGERIRAAAVVPEDGCFAEWIAAIEAWDAARAAHPLSKGPSTTVTVRTGHYCPPEEIANEVRAHPGISPDSLSCFFPMFQDDRDQRYVRVAILYALDKGLVMRDDDGLLWPRRPEKP